MEARAMTFVAHCTPSNLPEHHNIYTLLLVQTEQGKQSGCGNSLALSLTFEASRSLKDFSLLILGAGRGGYVGLGKTDC